MSSSYFRELPFNFYWQTFCKGQAGNFILPTPLIFVVDNPLFRLAYMSLILFLALCGWASPVFADLYYSGNMGVVAVEDSSINDGNDSGEMSFDDGFAATGALGDALGNGMRVEMELGYRVNDLNRIAVDGYGTTRAGGNLKTISLMGNAYYDFLNAGPFRPFIGVGAGVADIEADIDLVGTEDDTVFAYQIAAGGSLAVNDRLSIDVQYRYFATEDPNFDGLKAEYATHNLFFGLRFNF